MTTKTPLTSPQTGAGLGAPTGARRDIRVTTAYAERELINLLLKLAPAAPGWRAVLMNVPGHRVGDWKTVGTGALNAAARNALSAESICHVFLLEDNSVVSVTREPDALLLPDFEQALARVLQQDDGTPDLRHFDLTTDTGALLDIVRDKQARAEALHAEQARQAAHARMQALRFDVPADLIALRHHRRQKIVLVVEDDTATAMLLATLVDPRLKVVTAHDAAEAVRQYRAHVPDMVFLDIGLPDVDGLTLLAHIKAADPAACVVMLTANAYRDNLDRALAAGVTGFVAKPFTRDKIAKTTESCLKK